MKKTTKTLSNTQNQYKHSLHANNLLQAELEQVNHSLNLFLRKQFKIAICPDSFDLYLKNVQDLFVHLTTSKISTLISSLFSKIGNILQPFISHNYMAVNDQIRHEIAKHQAKCQKYKQKIRQLKLNLQEYHKKTNKLMSFIYTLRVNNINVDKLYELSMSNNMIQNQKPVKKQNKKQHKVVDFNDKKNFQRQQNKQYLVEAQVSQLSMAFKKKVPVYQTENKQLYQIHEAQKIKISTNETNRSKSKKTTGKFASELYQTK